MSQTFMRNQGGLCLSPVCSASGRHCLFFQVYGRGLCSTVMMELLHDWEWPGHERAFWVSAFWVVSGSSVGGVCVCVTSLFSQFYDWKLKWFQKCFLLLLTGFRKDIWQLLCGWHSIVLTDCYSQAFIFCGKECRSDDSCFTELGASTVCVYVFDIWFLY